MLWGQRLSGCSPRKNYNTKLLLHERGAKDARNQLGRGADPRREDADRRCGGGAAAGHGLRVAGGDDLREVMAHEF